MGQSIQINGEAGKKDACGHHYLSCFTGYLVSYLYINTSIFVKRFPSTPSDCLAASFFGDSYVHQRMAEVSSDTSLHIRFRTSAQAGLLFLAAGRRDFLLLDMVSGRLQVKKRYIIVIINEKKALEHDTQGDLLANFSITNKKLHNVAFY